MLPQRETEEPWAELRSAVDAAGCRVIKTEIELAEVELGMLSFGASIAKGKRLREDRRDERILP